jgi:hypothetical protein
MSKKLLIKSATAAWVLTESVNRVVNSSDFSADSWIKYKLSVTAGQTDPDGGTEAYTATATGAGATLQQVINFAGSNLNRVFSIYLKRKTGAGAVSIMIDGVAWVAKSITASWVRYDLPGVVSGNLNIGVKIAVSGDEVYVAFAQAEDGETPTDYAETGSNLYAITQITDVDYPINTVRGVVFLDGFFFVMTPKGEINQSALEDPLTWSSLDFIQSQYDPSRGVAIAKSGSYIVAFKERSIEFFYNAGNPVGSVLSPVQNANVQIGCATDGAIQDIGGGSVVFIGKAQNGSGYSVFTLTGTSPQKISTPAIEKYIGQDGLSEVHSWFSQVGSHALYGITLVTTEKTLVYDLTTQQWSLFSYLNYSGSVKTISAITAEGVVTSSAHGLLDGAIVKVADTGADFDGWHVATAVTANTFQIQATGTAFSGAGAAAVYLETYFPVVSSADVGGVQYMQGRSNGVLYEFTSSEYADAIGAIAARVRTPKLDNGSIPPKFMAYAEVVGDKIESTLLARYTDDDYVTYSTFRPIDLSANRSRIRRLGNYNRRAFELLHVKDANLRLEGLEIND